MRTIEITDDDQLMFAQLLANFMSELSEEAYCAGWMDGLEYSLYHFVKNGAGAYGQTHISDEDIAKLKRLSELAGGWIDGTDEKIVPIEQWEEKYYNVLVNGRE